VGNCEKWEWSSIWAFVKREMEWQTAEKKCEIKFRKSLADGKFTTSFSAYSSAPILLSLGKLNL
jgi:hypothetical protein